MLCCILKYSSKVLYIDWVYCKYLLMSFQVKKSYSHQLLSRLDISSLTFGNCVLEIMINYNFRMFTSFQKFCLRLILVQLRYIICFKIYLFSIIRKLLLLYNLHFDENTPKMVFYCFVSYSVQVSLQLKSCHFFICCITKHC